MGLNVEDGIAGLDPVERRKVEEMAVEFIAEEMTLRELRTAHRAKGLEFDHVAVLDARVAAAAQDRSGSSWPVEGGTG